MEDGAPKKGYRLSSRAHLLTYPRTEFSLEDTFAELCKRFEGQYEYLVVCRELHEDGFPHCHFFIYYNKKKEVRDARVYYQLFGGKSPNIVDCDSPAGAAAYCKKHADYLEDGTVPVLGAKAANRARIGLEI